MLKANVSTGRLSAAALCVLTLVVLTLVVLLGPSTVVLGQGAGTEAITPNPLGVDFCHLPWIDFRSPSLVYQAWYDQGLHAWDISDPYLPREVGYYFSPRYSCVGPCGGGYPGAVNQHADRHTREVYQDRATGLLYMTDGNGGGLTVLRWTGAIPKTPPIPVR